MSGQRTQQALLDAHVELETTQWLWESTEKQVSTLIDATIQRIAERDYPFREDDEESILQRERVEPAMLRSARYTTLMRAWSIFEAAACWAADEHRRQGRPIGQKRPGESLIAWAERELALGANHPMGGEMLKWMRIVCRMRNLLVHTNGLVTHMKQQERDSVDQWVASKLGVQLYDGRIEVGEAFVSAALLTVSMAPGALGEPLREQYSELRMLANPS